jgi:hypothetical protein
MSGFIILQVLAARSAPLAAFGLPFRNLLHYKSRLLPVTRNPPGAAEILGIARLQKMV